MAEVIDPFAINLYVYRMTGDCLYGLGTADDCGFGMHARITFAFSETAYVSSVKCKPQSIIASVQILAVLGVW